MPEIKELNLETMPQVIRDWLGSESLTYILININRKLGFKDWRRAVIPELILKLATKELPPENFLSELSQELNISPSSAKILAHEIEEKALKPIDNPLRNELGVDIALIHLSEPTLRMPPSESLTPPSVPSVSEIQPQIKPVEIPPAISKPFIPPSGVTEAEIKPPAVSEVEPFVLHEEFPVAKPRETKPVMKPSFAFKMPSAELKPAAPKPVTAEIEGAGEPSFAEAATGKEKTTAATKRAPQRIVHYSGFKTPLSPFGENKKQ